MSNIQSVNLNRLSRQDIEELVTHGGKAELKYDRWDKIKDFFRTETRQDTINFLLKQMSQMPEVVNESGEYETQDACQYLRNFEAIASFAKPEELHQFGVDVHQTEEGGSSGWHLQFNIGSEQFASRGLLLSRESLEHLSAYSALYKLRGALADPRGALAMVKAPGWSASENSDRVMSLINSSLEKLKGTRGEYGEFLRNLTKDISKAVGDQNLGAGVDTEVQTPLLSSPAEGAALDLLSSINAGVLAKAGPRLRVVDLAVGAQALQSLDVRDLIGRDANFEGASVQQMTAASAKFGGVTVRELLDRGANFKGANLISLLAGYASLEGTSLRELMGKGVKGGGYPVFPARGEIRVQSEQLALHPPGQESKLKVVDVLAAGFKLCGDAEPVPIEQVAGQFDLRDCPLTLLESNGVDYDEASVKELHDLGVSFAGRRAADLMKRNHMSFAELTPDQVANDLGIDLKDASVFTLSRRDLKISDTHVSSLLDKGANFTGVELKKFLEAGASCAQVDLRTLRNAGMSFKEVTLDDLTSNKVILAGTPAEELLDLLSECEAVDGRSVKALIDAGVVASNTSVSPPRDIALIRLLGNGMSLEGVEIGALRGWNPSLKGCHVRQLMDGTHFEGASVKWLKSRDASFLGMGYAALRAAKADFGGLEPRDIAALGADSKEFFAAVSVTELMEAADLQLDGVRLSDLLSSGASLQDVSVARLLERNVGLDGLNLRDLTAAGASLEGLGIAELHGLAGLGLRFDGTNIADLSQAKIVLQGVEITRLPKAIRFDRLDGPTAIGLGLSLTSRADQDDFEARGGKLLQQQEKPPEARKPPEGRKPPETPKPAEAPKPPVEDRGAAPTDPIKGVPLTELLANPNVNLKHVDLYTRIFNNNRAELAKLRDVSVAALLRRGVLFYGLNLKDLTKGRDNLKGLGIAELQQLEKSGLKFDGTQIGDLSGAKVDLERVKITDLPKAIRFDNVPAQFAVALGLNLSSKDDLNEFLARGGSPLQQQEKPFETRKSPAGGRGPVPGASGRKVT